MISTQKKVVIAGIGFFSDAYDLFVLNMVMVILSELYHTDDFHRSLLSSTALLGAILGQLAFGVLGDLIGRTHMWVLTIILISFASLGSALAFSGAPGGLYAVLAVWRLLLGIGIGGEYPLASTVSSEASSDENRGANTAKVFAAQGWGNMCAPLVVVVLLLLTPNTSQGLEFVWRCSLAFGAIPSLLTLSSRLSLHQEEPSPTLSLTLSERWNVIYAHRTELLGTCGSWFLFDISFYANGLFSATVLSLMGFSEDADTHHKVMTIALENVLIASMALPGYYGAVYLIDRWGRRPLQQFGFAAVALVYFVMGVWTDALIHHRVVFVCLYGLSFYFSNLGPNTTTFVTPSEVFDQEVRTTCSGVSAASGKLGAVVGSATFPFILSLWGPSAVLIVSSVVSLIGLGVSLLPLVPETMGKPLHSIYTKSNHPESVELADFGNSLSLE